MEYTEEEKKILAQAARIIGRAKSEGKTDAARLNAKKPRKRPCKPLSAIPCSCPDPEHHLSRCLRYRAIKRRQARGLPTE